MINEDIKQKIIETVKQSSDLQTVADLSRRFNSSCDRQIVTGLERFLTVTLTKDTRADISGTVKLNCGRLKDFLFSVLSQNVRSKAIRDSKFKFVRELLNFKQDIDISFGLYGDAVSVKDQNQREFRDYITILEKLIIQTVKESLHDKTTSTKNFIYGCCNGTSKK